MSVQELLKLSEDRYLTLEKKAEKAKAIIDRKVSEVETSLLAIETMLKYVMDKIMGLR